MTFRFPHRSLGLVGLLFVSFNGREAPSLHAHGTVGSGGTTRPQKRRRFPAR